MVTQMMDDGVCKPGGRCRKVDPHGVCGVSICNYRDGRGLESDSCMDVWLLYRAWRLVSKGTTQ